MERLALDRGRAVIRDAHHRYLLLQEAEGPSKGTWTFPGGRVDPNEDMEHAVIRETKEETGFDIRIIKKIGSFSSSEIGHKFQTHIFEAIVISGELSPPVDEIMNAQWLSAAEIESMASILKGSYVLEAIKI